MESADSVGSTDLAPDTEPPTGRKRRILAAILSAAIPGVGHWLPGTKRTGTWLFSIFCVHTAVLAPASSEVLLVNTGFTLCDCGALCCGGVERPADSLPTGKSGFLRLAYFACTSCRRTLTGASWWYFARSGIPSFR